MEAVNFRIPITYFNASKLFYQKLGFDVVFESVEYGWISLINGGFSLGLYMMGQGGGTREVGGNVDFAIKTENFQELHEKLKVLPIAVSDIITSQDGILLFDVTDPNGNILTFME
ncbi:MAG: hypothetical protein Tsb004_27980 [Allomuricauda sp.]